MRDKQIIQLYETDKLTLRQIADKFELNHGTVRNILVKNNINLRRRGSKNQNSEGIKQVRKRSGDYVTKEQKQNIELFRKYGITLEQYRTMSDTQNDKCAICKDTTKLVVDHCHNTGAVRGLLCNNCNRGIGYLKDNKDNLKSAIDYISQLDIEQ